jgi:hypothetical protein
MFMNWLADEHVVRERQDLLVCGGAAPRRLIGGSARGRRAGSGALSKTAAAATRLRTRLEMPALMLPV